MGNRDLIQLTRPGHTAEVKLTEHRQESLLGLALWQQQWPGRFIALLLLHNG